MRVAASKAGVVAPPRAFGFHTFRRTLASVLVKMRVDVKTVQEILRHQNLKTTLEMYAKSMSEDRLKAQGMFLELLFSHRRTEPIGRGLLEREQQLPVIWKIRMGTKAFEMWWPGTESNRRRQPFQGCALPSELPGHRRERAVSSVLR